MEYFRHGPYLDVEFEDDPPLGAKHVKAELLNGVEDMLSFTSSELNGRLSAEGMADKYADREEVQTYAYGTNLEATDTVVSGWVPDVQTLTGQAIAEQLAPKLDKSVADTTYAGISRSGAAAVGQGEQVIDAANYIVGDGIADDTANFIGTLDDSLTARRPVLLSGDARTTATITRRDDVHVQGVPGARITGTGNGRLLEILPAAEPGGTVEAATIGATTVTVTGAAWVLDEHAGKWVEVADGATIHSRRVVSNTADTLTLEYGVGRAIPAGSVASFYTPIDEVRMADLTIDYQGADNLPNIVCQYVRNVEMTRLYSNNAGGNGIAIYNADRVRLVDCGSDDSGTFGIFVHNSDNVRVVRPTVKRWGIEFGIQLKDCRDGKVILGHADGDGSTGTNCYNLKCSGLNPARDLAVVDSYGTSAAGSNFEMVSITNEGQYYSAENFQFSNCTSRNAGGGGYASAEDAGAKPVGLRWDSCVVEDAGQVGFALTVAGMVATNLQARGCQYEGLRIGAADCRVTGGIMEDNSQSYTSGASRSSEVLATSARFILEGMEFRRTTAGKTIRALREASATATLVKDCRIVDTAGGYLNDYVLIDTASKAIGWNAVDTFAGTPAISKVDYATV